MKLINDLTKRAKQAVAQNDTEMATVCLNAIEAICELHRAGWYCQEACQYSFGCMERNRKQFGS